MFYEFQRGARKRKFENMVLEDQIVACNATLIAAACFDRKKKKKRDPDKARVSNWWKESNCIWNEETFKDNFRVNRETFEFICGAIEQDLRKKPTNRNLQPMEPAKQLAICLYQLAHGCTFTTVANLFAVSKPTACVTFSKVCKVLVRTLYNRFVCLPKSQCEWKHELKFLGRLGIPMCWGVGWLSYLYQYTHQKLLQFQETLF